jgi:hypothetical protein
MAASKDVVYDVLGGCGGEFDLDGASWAAKACSDDAIATGSPAGSTLALMPAATQAATSAHNPRTHAPSSDLSERIVARSGK